MRSVSSCFILFNNIIDSFQDHSTSPEKNTDLRTRTLERRSRKTAEEKEGQKSADDKPERKRGKSPIGQDNTDSVDVWSVRSIDFDTTETINASKLILKNFLFEKLVSTCKRRLHRLKFVHFGNTEIVGIMNKRKFFFR